jgi:1-acyl-sn-glycerol-3-phosphate acyltransferase
LPTGAAIVVANHSGALPYDGLVLKRAISVERPELEEARWLVEDQFFYAAFFGILLNRLGALRASPENAIRLLNEHRPVLVFPEGIYGIGKPYAERYQIKRFGRGGFVKIGLRQGVPIIPAALVGAEEAVPMLAKLPGMLGLPYLPLAPLGPVPLPSRWRIRFGEPLNLSPYMAKDANDPAVVQALTDQTRDAIGRMIQALLAERGSIFVG